MPWVVIAENGDVVEVTEFRQSEQVKHLEALPDDLDESKYAIDWDVDCGLDKKIETVTVYRVRSGMTILVDDLTETELYVVMRRVREFVRRMESVPWSDTKWRNRVLDFRHVIANVRRELEA